MTVELGPDRVKRFFLVIALLIGGILVWIYQTQDAGGRIAAEGGYRTQMLDRGQVIAQVSTAGTVSPTTTVIVGSQLSGQVVEILADFNSEVKAGQLLARLNSDQIRAKADAARADLAQARAARSVQDAQMEKARADISRAGAVADDMRAQYAKSSTQFADASKTLERQSELASRGIVSAAGLQSATTQRDTLNSQRNSAAAQIESATAQIASLTADLKVIEAQMLSGDAQIQQRAAVVRQIEVDIANSEIRSPVDGVVIQRNVELGMPVAASLQAPTLFLVAQDLRRIEIQANVDEADVGRVKPGQEVTFNVNAYPGRTFSGIVKQVRLGSQTVQNVVIYTSVISVDNSNLDLRPGMTANLRILTERRDNVVRVPNAALRWRPPVSAEALSYVQQPAQEAGEAPAGPFVEPQGGRGGGGRGGGGGQNIGALAERLRSDLGLDEKQLRELDKVIAEAPPRSPGATGGQAAPEQRGGSGREAREAFIEKVNAFLTPDQRTRFRDLRQDMRPERTARAAGITGIPGRVYRIDTKGLPMSVPIRLGANDGAFTEVVSGLEAGAPVIVGGAPPGNGRSGFGGLRFGM